MAALRAALQAAEAAAEQAKRQEHAMRCELEAKLDRERCEMGETMRREAEEMLRLERAEVRREWEEEAAEAALCSVCLERPLNCTLGCGHRICMTCAEELGRRGSACNVCPSCRKQIQTMVRTFQ